MYLLSGPAEYCHREIFNATCETNEVVVMQMARYGRMSLGKCIKIDLGYLGCVVDVLSVMDYKCSGRSSCSLNVDDDILYSTKPCPADITPHLQASYSCIKGKSLFVIRGNRIHGKSEGLTIFMVMFSLSVHGGCLLSRSCSV